MARGRARRKRNLILDVGFNEGGDAQAYLSMGYHVVGVEANPRLVQAANYSVFFSRFLRHGVLKLVSRAVARNASAEGLVFYQHPNSVYGQLGQPHKRCEENGQNICKKRLVQSATCQDVIDEYGVPLYLKVDVEGSDAACVQSLRSSAGDPCSLPLYVSIEYHGLHETQAAVRHLHALGYGYFKVVGQDPFNVRHPVTWMAQGSGPFGDWARDVSLERSYADVTWALAKGLKGLQKRAAVKALNTNLGGDFDIPDRQNRLHHFTWFDVHARLVEPGTCTDLEPSPVPGRHRLVALGFGDEVASYLAHGYDVVGARGRVDAAHLAAHLATGQLQILDAACPELLQRFQPLYLRAEDTDLVACIESLAAPRCAWPFYVSGPCSQVAELAKLGYALFKVQRKDYANEQKRAQAIAEALAAEDVRVASPAQLANLSSTLGAAAWRVPEPFGEWVVSTRKSVLWTSASDFRKDLEELKAKQAERTCHAQQGGHFEFCGDITSPSTNKK